MSKSGFSKKKMLGLMGKMVLVGSELGHCKAGVPGGVTLSHFIYKLKNPRIGWVVGFRYLPVGNVEYQYEASPIFTPNGKPTPCILVSFWPTAKPIRVPLDGFKLVADDVPDVIKELVGPYAPGWNKEAREAMTEFASDYPRDAKGRFV